MRTYMHKLHINAYTCTHGHTVTHRETHTDTDTHIHAHSCTYTLVPTHTYSYTKFGQVSTLYVFDVVYCDIVWFTAALTEVFQTCC